MNRRSRSISPRRYRGNSASGGAGSGSYRRYSRSRSRSRERSRDQIYRRRNSRSRSRERDRDRDRYRHGSSHEKDLYRDIINSDYQEERNYANSTRNAGGNNGTGLNCNAINSGGSNNAFRFRNDDIYNDDRVGDISERSREKNSRDYDREYERERKERDYRRHGNGGNSSGRRYNSNEHDRDSDESDDNMNDHVYNKTPSNTIIVLGLQSHITEADIMSALIQMGMSAASIRLIRKRTTGASRGFAFVEFNTVDEAAHWMELTQGSLLLQDTCRGTLQYSHSREQGGKSKVNANDWYCGKCGVFNFKRRDNCFKCCASREESERGGEGSDEISNILTKKIMLRNLDVLTNEEGVLTAIQQHAPELAKKITKVLISRDALTQTSRGICYLNFETLIDSMGLHNVLSTLDPALKIDGREIIITYCIDHENRQMGPKKGEISTSASASNVCHSSTSNVNNIIGPLTAGDIAATAIAANSGLQGLTGSGSYTLADVPRLAEYSASVYATTPAEHAHYLQYYTDYYISEINKGSFGNLPTDAQLTEANSGAAVALSAIQRKQKKMNSIETTATAAAAAAASAAAAVKASFAVRTIVTPKGNDGKIYPTPDVSLYQYDETSGYYYDPTTGLYYDAHSQYYYNNETGAYLYWDQRKSTYVLATPASAAASVNEVIKKEAKSELKPPVTSNSNNVDDENNVKKEKKDSNKHDKVKVAKKIVKDMEKWAKQLNQKKDYTVVSTPQTQILTSAKTDETIKASTTSAITATATACSAISSSLLSSLGATSGYADVGFSILEKKTSKLTGNYNVLAAANTSNSGSAMAHISTNNNKVITSCGSDSEDDNLALNAKINASEPLSEKDYVDFQKLTCLLCKRAFQSLDILQKHLKMSNLHKENLAKHNLESKGGLGVGSSGVSTKQTQGGTDSLAAALSYRDRAKERRQKYGECDPPPPNRSRERFETELSKMSARKNSDATPIIPIDTNNVGNRLLQKMGWSEGQGLGRKNQGRTSIIETEGRSTTAGLGIKSGNAGSGDDYKTYIKKMMKSRYESV